MMTSVSDVSRVLLADDHPVTREGLALLLEQEDDLEVVAQAEDGVDALSLYRQHRPDVVVLDLQMPRMGGADTTAAIIQEFPDARILLLTTFDGGEDIWRGLRAGAKAYLLKGVPVDELLKAVRLVRAGRKYIPFEVAEKLTDRMAAPELTTRENQVLNLIVSGKSNKEIAGALGISTGSVKSYTNSLFTKLAVSSRTEAAMEAVRRGISRAQKY